MVRLITVHGTFAGDPSSRGEKWWQKGSPFLTELQSFIGEPLEPEPFHWSGLNSEMDRRRTGAKLASVIHDRRDTPIVIGHSHGGTASILGLALLYLRHGRQCCDMVRGFVTIGTPMLLFRSNRNPFSRFDVTGRLLLLFAVGLIGLKLGELASGTAYDGTPITGIYSALQSFAGSVQFGLAVFILAALYAYGFRNRQRDRLFRRNTLFKVFEDRYVALNHGADEAINGLQKAKAVTPKLVKRSTVFISIFSGLSFSLIGLFFLVQLIEASPLHLPGLLGESFALLQNAFLDPFEDILYANFPIIGETPILRQALATLTLVPILAVVMASAFIALLSAFSVTPILTEFVSNQIKSQSFGDDGYGETIRDVVPGLDFAADGVGTLPPKVEHEMERASVQDAGEAIKRLRQLLASGELLDAEGADLISQSMKFEKSELLHNAYFHSPLFVRYLAAVLVARFGLTPSDRFAGDAAAQRFKDSITARQGKSSPAGA